MPSDGGMYRASLAGVMEKVRSQHREEIRKAQEGKAVNLSSLPSPHLGEIVLYKMPAGPTEGELRPALVMKVYDEDDMVDLRVIIDGDYDADMGMVRMVKRGQAAANSFASHWIPKSEQEL